MKLSKQTIAILKNFSTINQSIVLNPGKQLKTISPQKTIMSVATITDEIPSVAGIYDISRFLSICSLYNDPDIEFGTREFTISEGNRKTKYTYADSAMIVSPPQNKINLPAPDVEFNVKWSDFDAVLKAAAYLQLPEIAFVGENGKCFLRAIKKEDPTADTYSIELEDITTKDEFVLIIKTENLKIMPIDYVISLSSKGVSKFAGDQLEYYIPVDQKSEFKKG